MRSPGVGSVAIQPPPNQLGTGELASGAETWLHSRGAVWAWRGADGVIEFSRRPVAEALRAAARDLLASPRASVIADAK